MKITKDTNYRFKNDSPTPPQPEREATHTPLPWKVIKPQHGHDTKYRCVQIGSDPTYSTLELKPEDARFIVKAVNSHDELLAACKWIVDFCEEHDQWFFHGTEGRPEDGAEFEWLATTKAAIARAEKGGAL